MGILYKTKEKEIEKCSSESEETDESDGESESEEEYVPKIIFILVENFFSFFFFSQIPLTLFIIFSLLVIFEWWNAFFESSL